MPQSGSSRRPHTQNRLGLGLATALPVRDPSPTPAYTPLLSPYPSSQQSHNSYATNIAPMGYYSPSTTPVPSQLSSAPPLYHAPPSSVAAAGIHQPMQPQSRLPYFEAALARARGEEPSVQQNVPLRPESIQPQYAQPLPSYLPPPDPNHPDLAVGFHQSSTVRFAMGNNERPYDPYYRETSRSPSPGYDDSMTMNYADLRSNTDTDVEKGLLSEQGTGYRFGPGTLPGAYAPLTDVKINVEHHSGFVSDADGDLSLGGPKLSMYKSSFGHQDSMQQLQIEDEDTQHFGPAPTGRVGRRTHNAAGHRRIKQKVTLDDNGFFAVDMPIPTRLSQFLPVKGVEEQKTTRYTAVTTDPDGFAASGLQLRQNLCDPPRQTELFIVITMYNENAELFCRTLYGVMKNIAHLCGRKNSRVWGANGWQKVVVCIVADGRKAVNPRVLDCLAALGVYQEGAMTNSVKDRPVTAHVFEYTTSFALDPDLHFKYPDKGIVPCQIIFCMKEKNAKKINSHRWFFNAFAPLLSPNVCILLDVGTMPAPKALYHLWKAFDLNSNVGGACGEIATFKGKTWLGLLNPLVAAQCFEYKMSNILDKPMESLFGYCAVLPGAFSAYRWIALQNNNDGTGPLASYFMGENLHSGRADSFTANMYYLAEDRILCFEIVAKLNANWVLKYVKSAVGETDCPDTIPEFIGQRRRWLNGSFFAALYALIHVRQIWRSDHSLIRKICLMVEFTYNALNLLFSWFSLANYYIFFVILTDALEGSNFNIPHINVLNTIVQYGYLGALVACFIFAMGNRPQGSPWKYKLAIYFLAILTAYMLICAVLCTIQAIKNFGTPVFSRMVISLGSTYGVFVVSSILALDPWHIITCFLQYMLFTPTYINVLNIYAYSNLHDLSWGTKGSDTVQAVDLGSVQGVGKDVEVELVSAQQDIDIAYQDALDNIRLKRARVDDDEIPPKPEASQQKQKDIYANFRTNLLLLWSLSNALLASIILSGSDTSSTFTGSGNSRTGIYMLVILIFVAGMAIFRFICSTLYLIIRLFGG